MCDLLLLQCLNLIAGLNLKPIQLQGRCKQVCASSVSAVTRSFGSELSFTLASSWDARVKICAINIFY